MIIHIEICDVCRRINRGGLPVENFTTNGASWDVGPCCQDGRFTTVRHTNVIKNHLLARIEALIVTELSLLKDPV